MKVVFYALISIVLFLVVFSFVAQNPHDIKINYYFGTVWDGPVATLLILTLCLGIVFGISASALGLLKLKMRLLKVVKQVRSLQSQDPLARERTTKEGN